MSPEETTAQFLQSVEEVKNLPTRTKLAELVIALVEAEDRANALWATYGSVPDFDGDAAHDADNASYDARKELYAHLTYAHGLTEGQIGAMARAL